MKRLLTTCVAALMLGCAPSEVLYTQRVTFPKEATAEDKIAMAARVVPSAEQLAWQRLELTAFIHFGINTFTDNEWGSGLESPELFNPTALDAEQWVLTLKRGGFKMVILTAKHHDGFCLWPTATTPHSVAHSPWRDGKGDVVRELSDACKKHDMKFGLYLSPWDRNAACYGDSPAYNEFFIAQLTELLTNYGRVDEVWFDGACGEGSNGKRQVYDWPSILATIERLQPNAVTAIMGDDVRWVGNEGGRGRTTEWSVTPYTPKSYSYGAASNEALGLEEMSSDLGSRELVARAEGLYWYPSEVDVSIRPGWFYHASQDDMVRPLANLVDIYFSSVGRNSVLLLNIPPDRRGLIHETDAERIAALRDYLDSSFATNFVRGRVDYWCVNEGDSRVFEVEEGAVVNTLLLAEDIKRGQRVERFVVEAFVNGKWRHIAEGTTIGYKRLLRFSDCRAERIRITINECRTTANIADVGLYYAEPLHYEGQRIRTSDVATDGWQTVDLDACAAIDGDAATAWRSDALTPLTIDMGITHNIAGLCYAPATDDATGTIFIYNAYLSEDGNEWVQCVEAGEFSNIKNNPVPYYVNFGRSYPARYLRIEPLREIDDRKATSVGEIGVLLPR
ncbi:MAG: alpha-L-fucosidase [Alistipes sp.]|nr:alpha-L-fucosidase [Alistipes sp.]